MLQNLIKEVKVSIDRIDISFQEELQDVLIETLNKQCLQIETGKFVSKSKKLYSYYKYKYKDSLLTLKIEILDGDKPVPIYQRAYLTVSDPTVETQGWLKSICSKLSEGKSKGRHGILVQQIEVAYDFITATKQDAEAVWRYIGQHFYMRWTRADSYRTIETTLYCGSRGDLRKGSKGSRSYVKRERGNRFCRHEGQFNRPYLRKKLIDFEDLPLDPMSFRLFDKVLILNSFSEKGLRNYSRTILRKQGVLPTMPGYAGRHRNMVKLVKRRVFGSKAGAIPRVAAQINNLKNLNRQFGLSVNYRVYFDSIKQDAELIACLVDIGQEEEGCSKRIAMVIAKEDYT